MPKSTNPPHAHKSAAFIVMEGPDGSGKTTAMTRLASTIRQFGFNVVTTREPGGTKIAEDIRGLILKKWDEDKVLPLTEALLFAAARHEHVERFIKPHLEKGNVVISDRFFDSSFAYQGIARRLVGPVFELRQMVMGNFAPDYSLYLDLPFAEADRRLKARDLERNHFDEETVEFRKDTFRGYGIAKQMAPGIVQSFDASQSIENVGDQIEEWVINTFVKNHDLPPSAYTPSNGQLVSVMANNPNRSKIQEAVVQKWINHSLYQA